MRKVNRSVLVNPEMRDQRHGETSSKNNLQLNKHHRRIISDSPGIISIQKENHEIIRAKTRQVQMRRQLTGNLNES